MYVQTDMKFEPNYVNIFLFKQISTKISRVNKFIKPNLYFYRQINVILVMKYDAQQIIWLLYESNLALIKGTKVVGSNPSGTHICAL